MNNAHTDPAYALAVIVARATHDTTAQNVRLGDEIARLGTVTEVSRFGGLIYIEGTRDMIVKHPECPVTVTRAL